MNAPPRENDGQLVRRLGRLDATMIVVGSMIGSGIFITSAESARLIGAPGWLLLAWTVAGVMTITGALCCSELAAMMPRAGGVYVFLREAYGPSLGFLFGWTLFLVIQTGTIAAVAIAFAKFTGVFAPAISAEHYVINPIVVGGYAISLSTEQLVAIVLILLLSWTNTRGLETGKIVQNTFTFAKTAALLAVIVIGLSLGWKPESAARASDWWNSWRNGWNPQIAQPGLTAVGALALVLLFGKAMVGPLFAQTAWTNVTFIGGEIRDPGRNLARALLGGCALVVVFYVLANLAYVAVLPLSEIQHASQNRVAVAVMNSIFGRPGALAMAAAIMISTFGCNNGLILAGARVYYAMARDGLFFRRTATINRHDVPGAALIAQGIWTVFLTLPRTVITDATTGAVSYGNVYTQLLEYIVSADLVFYVLLVVAVIVLRKKCPAADRPYRTWGYPMVPIVSVVLAAFLIVDLAWLAPTTSGIGYLLVLTGIPVYFIWRRHRVMNARLPVSLIACAICAATATRSWASGGAVETMRDFQNASHSPNPPDFQLNTNVQLFVNRGDLAFRNGRYEEAVSCFTSALQGQSPSDKKATAAIYSRRCAALLHLKRLDKAFADANAAIALDPGLFNPYVNRGLIHRLRGQLDDAMRDYNTAIQLNPGAVLAFNNRGIVYHHRGQYQRAIQDFNDAIRLDPNYANAYLNRGTSYQALRQFNRAIADYTEAIRRDPRVENAHFNRGNLYFELGDYDRAIADLTEAIRRNSDPKAYALRAQAYSKKKQPEKRGR